MNAFDGAMAANRGEAACKPAPPDNTPVARLEAVSLAADGGSPEPGRMSFALPPGSVHVLTGPPGAGKSRVLSLLGLERRPIGGRIQIFGRDVATLGPRETPLFRRRIGRVFETDRLLEHLTLFDNAALVPRIAGRRRADYRGEVTEVLAWLGLARHSDALPGVLDAAGRRRLALARAVVNRPDLLLVDEPGAGLDERAVIGLLERLAELNAAGTTLFMAIGGEDQARRIGAPILRLGAGAVTRVEAFDRARAS